LPTGVVAVSTDGTEFKNSRSCYCQLLCGLIIKKYKNKIKNKGIVKAPSILPPAPTLVGASPPIIFSSYIYIS